MGAAVAGAVAAVAGFLLYLYKRRDAPAAVRERGHEKRRLDYEEFDDALGEQDADAVTRMFSELDDARGLYGLRTEDGGGTGRPGDTGPV